MLAWSTVVLQQQPSYHSCLFLCCLKGSTGGQGGNGSDGSHGTRGENGSPGSHATFASDVHLMLSGDCNILLVSGSYSGELSMGGVESEGVVFINAHGGNGGHGGAGGRGTSFACLTRFLLFWK